MSSLQEENKIKSNLELWQLLVFSYNDCMILSFDGNDLDNFGPLH